jgi:hypothetical protein
VTQCRTSTRTHEVAVGEHDRFLPPRRRLPAVRRTINVESRVCPSVSHLITPGHLDEVVSLVAEVIDAVDEEVNR